MADVKKKKQVHHGHKNHVRKTIKEAKEFTQGYDGENDEIEAELKACKEVLVDKLAVLKELDEEILGLTEESDIKEETNTSGDFSKQIKKCIIEIDNALRKNTKVSQENKPAQHNATISVQPKSSESSVKLPKITIKKFDGKPVHWTTFWDSHNVTVHLNESLSKVQKFTYLLSLLEGTASDTVSGFTLTDSNYDAAVELFHERYSNKQLIINSHMEQLVQLPQITHEEHTKKLRNLLTDIETHVRSLNSLGISTSSFGNFVVPLILNKLPQKLRVDIGRKFKSPSELWQLDDLLKAFKEELTARETARVEPELFKSGDKKRFEPFRNQSKPFTSQVLYTGRPAKSRMANAENQNPGRNTPTCTNCSQGHPSSQCHVVTEVQARKSILRSKRKCFLCL